MVDNFLATLDLAELTDRGKKRTRNEDACRMLLPTPNAPERTQGRSGWWQMAWAGWAAAITPAKPPSMSWCAPTTGRASTAVIRSAALKSPLRLPIASCASNRLRWGFRASARRLQGWF